MKLMKSAMTTVCAFALAGGVHAQQVGVAQAQETDSTALQEIVVSAQRRSENLQNVPIVVTSISSEQLKASGITDLSQINTLVPGLTLRQAAGDVQTSIRGVGASINGGENTAAIYIDDVYLPLQRDGLRELPDVEQISVLKGPQGTLFGRNATAGVIQITTLQPTQEFHVSGEATLGNYQTRSADAFVSGGLAENLAGSLSVRYDGQGEGYGRNLITGNGANQLRHSYQARGKLVFDPGTDTKITIAADYLDRDAYLHSLHQTPGTSFFLPAPPVDNQHDYYSQVDSKYTVQTGGASLKIEHLFDFATFKSISAYRRSDSDTFFDAVPTGVPALYVGIPQSPSNSFSQELQLVSTPSAPVSWAAGVFYFHASDAQSPQTLYFFPALFGVFAGSPPGFLPSRTDTFGKETTNSVAAYSQADFKLLPTTTLTLGARYTYERRTITGNIVSTFYSDAVVDAPTPSQSTTVEKPTWRIALNHQLTSDEMIYASYSRGFKSGGFNLGAPDAPAFQPEKLDSYEVGLKSEIFDHRLRLNLGGFYYDYTNMQVTQFINGVTNIENGAKSRIYGLDVNFEARLTQGLTLSGGVEVMDPKFVKYNNAPGATPNPSPPGGTTADVFDAAGKQIPGAQKFTGTLIADYLQPISYGTLNFNFIANYNSTLYFEPDNFIHQGSYTMLDTSVRWTSSDGHLNVTLWGKT